MISTRRGLFGWLAGAAAFPVVGKLLPPLPELAAERVAPLMPQLVSITRTAFVPKIAVQVYHSQPFLSMAVQGKRLRTGDPVTLPDGKAINFDWSGYDRI
jgi:hypothetical protein